MEVYGIIYKITNLTNGKCYIGQTNQKRGFKDRYSHKGMGIERVYKEHKSLKQQRKCYNSHLLYSIEKYGFKAFKVEECFDVAYSQEELNELEIKYIKEFNCIHPNGYNNKEGGDNGKLSELSKQKISEKAKGRYLGENNPMYGKHHDETTKALISKSLTGRNISEETREIWSQQRKGENNINAKAVYWYELDEIRMCGQYWCEELEIDISHMSACCKGKRNHISNFHFRYATEEELQNYDPNNNTILTREEILLIKLSKMVYCEEKKDFRITPIEWAKELNINRGSITACCKGKQKQTKGYHFRYATEEEIKEYIKTQNLL